ncbi:MAG: glutathione-disulfide reductase [Rickettsiales bacterium]|nr:glutathione-disulfide reductase [Rickettsiales bacterium]
MNFDLFVIGGGSGGVRAARLAGSKGLKVGLAEGWDLGGTCVNRGCIPKKLYSYSSHFNDEVEIMKSFGWSTNGVSFNWTSLVENKNKELKRLNNIYKNLLSNAGVEVFPEWASFKNNNTIELSNGLNINAKNILISVGGEPVIPEIKGSNSIITSDEAFDLKKLPKNILIMGGGYIAVEFASIFNGLGVDTTICIRSNTILRGFDEQTVLFLKDEMEKKGIKFLFESTPKEITKKNEIYSVDINNKEYNFEVVMAAIGRKSNTKKLKLEKTDIKTNENGSIIVNDYFETSSKNIFAIGDVIDRVQLTPVAINEAVYFIKNLEQTNKDVFKYKNIPTAIFSNPNMATVGLSEELARKKYETIDVYVSEFKPLKFTLSNINERVFIKLIVEKTSDRVVGLHYIGNDAAEIVQGFSVAIVSGLKKSDFDRTVGIHPSSAEEIVTLKQKL